MTRRLATITLVCTMVATSAQAAPGLRCAVQAPAQVEAGHPVMLRFTLSNPGPSSVQMLRWNTPFEGGWFAPFVQVMRDGAELAYQGPMLKRGDPAAQNYLRIAAGASEVAEVNLGLPFDLRAPGRYRVQPQVQVIDLFDDAVAKPPRVRDQHQGLALACPTVEFEIVGAPAARSDRD